MLSPSAGVVPLLQALVRIPSVNPAASSDPADAGEARIAAALAETLRAMGAADVTTPEVLPGRPNLIAKFPADRPGKPRLLLAPHLDTVSVGGMTIPPFSGELRDGRVWGRGSTDTKGTLAAMLCALWELRDAIPRLSHEIWFCGLMDEEAGNRGAQWIVDQGIQADFALIGEPTDCDLVRIHKGALWLRLSTRGRAAHAATPERGENALYAMADAARAVRDELVPWLAKETHPELGHATTNLGVLRGGVKINVVPDRAEAELDLRTLPGAQQEDSFVDQVAGILRKAAPTLEVDLIRRHRPMVTDRAHPLVGKLEAAGGQCTSAAWFCDGALLAHAGIPSVAAGPGSIAQAHTTDEFLAVDDLERGVAFYRKFLESL